jgi:hypothetical protein
MDAWLHGCMVGKIDRIEEIEGITSVFSLHSIPEQQAEWFFRPV